MRWAPRQAMNRSEYAEQLAAPWKRDLIKTMLEADAAREQGDHLEVSLLQRRAAAIRRHLARLETLA